MARRSGEDAGRGEDAKGRRPIEILSATGLRSHDPRGRPSLYTRELSDQICARLSAGESLIKICATAEMPTDTTVRMWAIEDRDGFSSRYAVARRALMDRWAEDILVIADDVTLEPNDRRVRVDTRKWLMSKLDVKRYGDKLIHSGDPDNPVTVLHKVASVEHLSQAELDALDSFTQARLTSTVIDADYTVLPPDKPNS